MADDYPTLPAAPKPSVNKPASAPTVGSLSNQRAGWPTDDDYYRPSVEYLATGTRGPLSNERADTQTVQKTFNRRYSKAKTQYDREEGAAKRRMDRKVSKPVNMTRGR